MHTDEFNRQVLTLAEGAVFLGVDAGELARLIAACKLSARADLSGGKYLGSRELLAAAEHFEILDVRLLHKIRNLSRGYMTRA